MSTPSEEEARAAAERIEKETYDRWKSSSNGPAGLAKELVVAGAMWAASRVSTEPSEGWEYARMNGYGHVAEPDDALEDAMRRAAVAASFGFGRRGYVTVVRRRRSQWEPVPAVPVLPTEPAEEAR